MITKQQLLDLVNFDFKESARFEWDCYGPTAFIIDAWDTIPETWCLSAVVDLINDTVYEVTISDVKNEKSYRLFFDEYFRKEYMYEAGTRNAIQVSAYGDDIIDLETAEDFLEKARAIIEGREYSEDVLVPLDISKEDFNTLALAAHEQGITFNQHVVNILMKAVKDQEISEW